jgi:hypothetical protein
MTMFLFAEHATIFFDTQEVCKPDSAHPLNEVFVDFSLENILVVFIHFAVSRKTSQIGYSSSVGLNLC